MSFTLHFSTVVAAGSAAAGSAAAGSAAAGSDADGSVAAGSVVDGSAAAGSVADGSVAIARSSTLVFFITMYLVFTKDIMVVRRGIRCSCNTYHLS